MGSDLSFKIVHILLVIGPRGLRSETHSCHLGLKNYHKYPIENHVYYIWCHQVCVLARVPCFFGEFNMYQLWDDNLSYVNTYWTKILERY